MPQPPAQFDHMLEKQWDGLKREYRQLANHVVPLEARLADTSPGQAAFRLGGLMTGVSALPFTYATAAGVGIATSLGPLFMLTAITLTALGAMTGSMLGYLNADRAQKERQSIIADIQDFPERHFNQFTTSPAYSFKQLLEARRELHDIEERILDEPGAKIHALEERSTFARFMHNILGDTLAGTIYGAAGVTLGLAASLLTGGLISPLTAGLTTGAVSGLAGIVRGEIRSRRQHEIYQSILDLVEPLAQQNTQAIQDITDCLEQISVGASKTSPQKNAPVISLEEARELQTALSKQDAHHTQGFSGRVSSGTTLAGEPSLPLSRN